MKADPTTSTSHNTLAILLVEDNPGDALLAREMLEEANPPPFSVVQANRLSEAVTCLQQNHIDAILLDLNLPDSQGLETLSSLYPYTSDRPILVLSGLQDEDMALSALKMGAQDYIVKGETPSRILAHGLHKAIERQQLIQSLTSKDFHIHEIIGKNSDGIIVVDHEGIIRFANPAAEKLFGRTNGELIDIPFGFPIVGKEKTEIEVIHKRGRAITVELQTVNFIWDEQPAQLVSLRDITEHKRAEAQIKRQLGRLRSLREIDAAITSSFDMRVNLDIVLQQVLSQLNVDAAAILLLHANTHMIEYAASRGFRSKATQYTHLKLGEGYAGRAVLERRTIHVVDLMGKGGKLAKALQQAGENFVDYYGAPLIVKGEVKGVLEIYQRSILNPDQEWLEFMETLAGQAAITIDNAQLFHSLQRANAELEQRVTERTQELSRTNNELEFANHAKDEFLAAMSHELRTPLNNILGLSETLLEEKRGSLNDHQRQALQTVESSGQHLLELINDILDLSKIEAGKFDYYPQVVNVDALCRASLAFVKEQAIRKSISIHYDDGTANFNLYGDPRRLKQILVNLLTNAVKFTPEHGMVTLEINAEAEADRVQFSVVDTGIGIAHENLKRLFKPFVQVDANLNRRYEGTGLGLFLVQRLTDLHGGSVQAESEVGKGSRFTINIPWHQATVAQLEDISSREARSQLKTAFASSESPHQNISVLLAEDNTTNIMMIGEYLENHGFDVIKAHDGMEAIEKAEQANPQAILMDIQMPAMDGLQAIHRLRANPRFDATPIIAITALAMPGDRERCLNAGANEYMAKPVSLKKLVATLNHLLQQGH